MPDLAPFPVDPILSGVAIAYKNPSMIADQVAPRVPVAGETFKFLKYSLAESFSIPDTKVGRKSQPNQVEFGATEETASTQDHGLDDLVPIKDLNNAPKGHNPLGHAVESLTDLVALAREKRTADLLFATGSYAAGLTETLSGTSQWSDYTNSDPLAAILAALDLCIIRPNVAVLGQAVWTKLRMHPNVVKAVHGNAGDAGVAARQAVADLLELDELLVGQGYANTAKKGQTVNLARLWGKHAAFIRRDKLATTQNGRPTFAITAQWGDKVAGQMTEQEVGLRGSIRVRSGESLRELILCPDVGYLFANAVA